MNTLVLPPAPTATGRLPAEAAARRGLGVRVLARRPVPAELAGRAHLYGGDAFAAEVAAALGIALLVPPPGRLAGLPPACTGRRVALTTLGRARGLAGPAFVKPAAGKSWPARVRRSGRDLPAGPDDTPVLVSEPVVFAAEYRLHVLDGAVRAAGRYARHGLLDPAPLETLPERSAVLGFAADVLRHGGAALPAAVVVDVGVLDDGRYAVVEANEAWFSNCYAADPDRVLDVVLRAAGPG